MNWLNNIFKSVGNFFSGGGNNNVQMKPMAGSAPRMGPMQSGPGGMQGPASMASRLGPSMAQFGISMLPKMGMDKASNMYGPQQSSPRGGGSMMDKMFQGVNPQQAALGMGINALGQFMAPKVNMPNFNDSPAVQQLSNFQYNKLPGNAEEAINRNLDIQFEGELRNLRNVYKNVRPGTDYTTDSAYQRDLANLQRQQTLNRADALAGQQLQYAQADQQRLQELASLDLAQIMAETGMNAQEAEQFKQSFSNIGTMFLQNAMPQQNNMSSLFDLFNPDKRDE